MKFEFYLKIREKYAPEGPEGQGALAYFSRFFSQRPAFPPPAGFLRFSAGFSRIFSQRTTGGFLRFYERLISASAALEYLDSDTISASDEKHTGLRPRLPKLTNQYIWR
jgi:hypothetical protein